MFRDEKVEGRSLLGFLTAKAAVIVQSVWLIITEAEMEGTDSLRLWASVDDRVSYVFVVVNSSHIAVIYAQALSI